MRERKEIPLYVKGGAATAVAGDREERSQIHTASGGEMCITRALLACLSPFLSLPHTIISSKCTRINVYVRTLVCAIFSNTRSPHRRRLYSATRTTRTHNTHLSLSHPEPRERRKCARDEARKIERAREDGTFSPLSSTSLTLSAMQSCSAPLTSTTQPLLSLSLSLH